MSWESVQDEKGVWVARRKAPTADERGKALERWLDACWVPPRYRGCTAETWRTRFDGEARPWPVELDTWDPSVHWCVVLLGIPKRGKTHAATALYLQLARTLVTACEKEVERDHFGNPLRFAWVSVPAACRRMRDWYELGEDRDRSKLEVAGVPCTAAYDEVARTFDLVLLDDYGAQGERGGWTERVEGWIEDRHMSNLPTIVTLNPSDERRIDRRIARRLDEGLRVPM